MSSIRRVLVVHTAFIGDIVLMLPTVQTLRASLPGAHIAAVVIPRAAEVLENHPAIDEVILFDKKGSDRGGRALLAFSRRIRESRFDAAVIPHRSIRSALLVRLAGIPVRIGFSTSAGRFLFTNVVPYRRDIHEIDRDLMLLAPIGIQPAHAPLPLMYPGQRESAAVDALLREHSLPPSGKLVGIAPGSVWNTKRWPEERFAELAAALSKEGYTVALIGGEADVQLCGRIAQALRDARVVNAAGRLTLLGSAELLRRCVAAVSNDSAPAHIAMAVGTPVATIFGATVPAFGFAPRGPRDAVVEIPGLACRPCSIHGGVTCPISTFECMQRITSEQVRSTIQAILDGPHATSRT